MKNPLAEKIRSLCENNGISLDNFIGGLNLDKKSFYYSMAHDDFPESVLYRIAEYFSIPVSILTSDQVKTDRAETVSLHMSDAHEITKVIVGHEIHLQNEMIFAIIKNITDHRNKMINDTENHLNELKSLTNDLPTI